MMPGSLRTLADAGVAFRINIYKHPSLTYDSYGLLTVLPLVTLPCKCVPETHDPRQILARYTDDTHILQGSVLSQLMARNLRITAG